MGEKAGTPLDDDENDMAEDAFIGLGCGLPIWRGGMNFDGT